MKKILALLLTALVAMLAGCHSGSSSNNDASVRALNAVVDAEPLDILVDDTVQLPAVAPNTVTSFVSVGSGTKDVKARSSTTQTVLVDKSLGFSGGIRNTILLFGKRVAMNELVLPEDTTAASSGHSRIRVVNLSPDAGPVDLYLTATDISATGAVSSSVVFGSVSATTEITSTNLKVVFTGAGTTDILFQSTAQQTFTAGTNYTIVAMPSLGGKLVNAVILQDGGGAGTFIANTQARVKAVNAMPDATVNVKIDGSTLLTNVPFTGTSSYLSTGSGTHTLQTELANVPGTTIASQSVNLGAARDYTMLATGTTASPGVVTLTDDNSVPNAGFAKIRFVNAIATGESVDVLLNFATQSTNIGGFSASPYLQTASGLNYTIGFSTPGGVTVIAQLTGAQLDAGSVYSAFLFGTRAAPQVKLVRDR